MKIMSLSKPKTVPSLSYKMLFFTVGAVLLLLWAYSPLPATDLKPMKEQEMRSVRGMQGIDLRMNLDLGGGFSSEFVLNDPESGGALHLDDFGLQLLLGRFSSRGLEIDLDGGNGSDPSLQFTMPGGFGGTEISDIKIWSEEIFIDNLDGFGSNTLGGLMISDMSGNPADLEVSGNFKVFPAN